MIREFHKELTFAVVVTLAALIAWDAAAQGTPQAAVMFRQKDRNNDGRLSKQEFPGPKPAFRRLDRNRDGYLSLEELHQGRAGAETSAPQTQTQPSPQPSVTATAAPSSGPAIYVDTHLHLHPRGLAEVMGKNAGAGGSASGGGGRMDLRGALIKAADNMIARMDRRGVAQALVVTVPSGRLPGSETYDAMRGAIARHAGRLHLMAGGATLNPVLQKTDPGAVTERTRRDFEARAEEVLRDGAKGFGEMIAYHLCMVKGHSFQHAPADHPLFLLLADVAARRNVPIDLHIEAVERRAPLPENLGRSCSANPATLEPTIPALERLLAHNRQARIVWQHIGWDNTGQMTTTLLERLLVAHPNLYLALRVEARATLMASNAPMANRIVDGDFRVMPEWLSFIAAHADRLVIGADDFISPADGAARGSQSFDETWGILDQLPAEAARKIGRDNARRLYNLN